MHFPHIRIVLVSPQGALNIGSVARVMKNFGFTDLRLVSPRTDHLCKQATDMAVSAKDTILRSARVHTSLEDALAGCHYTIATSTREGKYREELIDPTALLTKRIDSSLGQQMALVFGPEDHGLTTADLDLCTCFVRIQTAKELHSMNLAQAVTICLYELSKENEVIPKPQKIREKATFEDFEAMIAHMKKTFTGIEYLNPQNPDHIIHTYRRIFSRADLDPREVIVLHGLWSKIDYLGQFVPEETR